MNYGKLTAGTTKTAIDTAKPSEKGEIITYLSRMGDVLHNVFERGEIVLALVAVYAIGNGHQSHIMEREKLLGELAHLNVVPAQPGEVFHEHRRDVPGLDCGNHFLKAGALHSGAGDAVIHEKDGIGITLVLGGLLKYFLLVLDAVGLAVHVIVTAQTAVEGGCAEGSFIVRLFQNVLLPRVSDNQYFQVYCTSAPPLC